MVRVSNTIVGFLNSLFLLLGLMAMAVSVYFYVHDGTQCQNYLQMPLLIVGAIITSVSLLGLIGSCCRVNFVLVIYLILMFLLILGLICFTVFAILVTNEGVGKVVSGVGFKENRLGDYSNWLQNHLLNGNNWDLIKTCLIDTQLCRSLGKEVDKKASDFYKNNLSPTQSGCCQPPSFCGYQSKNATFWVAPKTGPAVKNSDCTTWSNQQETLCFDCNLCKAGFLDNIRKEWRNLAIFNGIALVVIIFIYSIGCCARKNNKADRNYTYKGWA